jgi:hypothetical protein
VISPTQENPPDHAQQSNCHPCPLRDSKPPSQQANALDRTTTGIDITQHFIWLLHHHHHHHRYRHHYRHHHYHHHRQRHHHYRRHHHHRHHHYYRHRHHHCHHHHHHHPVSVMELGHLLTRYGLMHQKVCYDFFCQLGNSVALSWIIY